MGAKVTGMNEIFDALDKLSNLPQTMQDEVEKINMNSENKVSASKKEAYLVALSHPQYAKEAATRLVEDFGMTAEEIKEEFKKVSSDRIADVAIRKFREIGRPKKRGKLF